MTEPIIAYVLIALPLWRRWAGLIARPIPGDGCTEDLSFDWGFGIFFGGAGALLWPVVMLIYLAVKLVGRLLDLMETTAPWLMMTQAEREARARIRDEQIRQWEQSDA